MASAVRALLQIEQMLVSITSDTLEGDVRVLVTKAARLAREALDEITLEALPEAEEPRWMRHKNSSAREWWVHAVSRALGPVITGPFYRTADAAKFVDERRPKDAWKRVSISSSKEKQRAGLKLKSRLAKDER